MPPRVLAALSRRRHGLTGANVALGKVIAAAIPVQIFVLFRWPSIGPHDPLRASPRTCVHKLDLVLDGGSDWLQMSGLGERLGRARIAGAVLVRH